MVFRPVVMYVTDWTLKTTHLPHDFEGSAMLEADTADRMDEQFRKLDYEYASSV